MRLRRVLAAIATGGLSERKPVPLNAHGYPMSEWHGHRGCRDGGDLGPCDCLCHRDPPVGLGR